jgi:hypothetical protein
VLPEVAEEKATAKWVAYWLARRKAHHEVNKTLEK